MRKFHRTILVRYNILGASHVTTAPARPSFPIERQIAIDASPVVLVNVLALDKAPTFLKTWQDAADTSRNPAAARVPLSITISFAATACFGACGSVA
jgi:hypothetical protein